MLGAELFSQILSRIVVVYDDPLLLALLDVHVDVQNWNAQIVLADFILFYFLLVTGCAHSLLLF